MSREGFNTTSKMRQQGAHIVEIATQVGCSERTVRRYLKYPEPPARKTRHKMAKLKPFMDYIDMRLAENVWNGEVILAEIKAMGYTGGRSMLVTTSTPNVICGHRRKRFASKLSPVTSYSMTGEKLRLRLPGNDAGLTSRLIRWGSHVASMSSRHQSRMLNIPMSHWLRAFRYFGGSVKTVLVDNQKAAVLK